MFVKEFERTASCGGVCGCGCGGGGGGGGDYTYVSLPLLPTSVFKAYVTVTSHSLTLESCSV